MKIFRHLPHFCLHLKDRKVLIVAWFSFLLFAILAIERWLHIFSISFQFLGRHCFLISVIVFAILFAAEILCAVLECTNLEHVKKYYLKK